MRQQNSSLPILTNWMFVRWAVPKLENLRVYWMLLNFLNLKILKCNSSVSEVKILCGATSLAFKKRREGKVCNLRNYRSHQKPMEFETQDSVWYSGVKNFFNSIFVSGNWQFYRYNRDWPPFCTSQSFAAESCCRAAVFDRISFNTIVTSKQMM